MKSVPPVTSCLLRSRPAVLIRPVMGSEPAENDGAIFRPKRASARRRLMLASATASSCGCSSGLCASASWTTSSSVSGAGCSALAWRPSASVVSITMMSTAVEAAGRVEQKRWAVGMAGPSTTRIP